MITRAVRNLSKSKGGTKISKRNDCSSSIGLKTMCEEHFFGEGRNRALEMAAFGCNLFVATYEKGTKLMERGRVCVFQIKECMAYCTVGMPSRCRFVFDGHETTRLILLSVSERQKKVKRKALGKGCGEIIV